MVFGANDAEGHPLPIRFFGDFLRAPKRAVAPDHERMSIFKSARVLTISAGV